MGDLKSRLPEFMKYYNEYAKVKNSIINNCKQITIKQIMNIINNGKLMHIIKNDKLMSYSFHIDDNIMNRIKHDKLMTY